MIGRLFRRTPARASYVNITPPVPDQDRQGIAICAIMRNEERHIEDWLRFHAIAGVKDFYLYDNLSTDQTIDRARAVPGIRTTILPWKLSTIASKPKMVIPQQIMAYCHAICTFGSRYRWMAFIDIDELIVPRANDSLLDALRPLEGYSSISLPWTMFGHNGHETPPTEAAPFAYTQRAAHQKGPLLNFKCILDPCKVTQVSVHKFQTQDMGATSANECGIVVHYKKRGSNAFLSNQSLQLNHYYTRSRAELEDKIRNGAVSGATPTRRATKVREKCSIIEQNLVLDTSAGAFLARKGILNTPALREHYLADEA